MKLREIGVMLSIHVVRGEKGKIEELKMVMKRRKKRMAERFFETI